MQRFSFRAGLEFVEGLGRRVWSLAKRTPVGKYLFEDEDGKTEALTPDEALERWRTRQWVIHERSLGKAAKAFYTIVPRDLKSLREQAREVVKRRLRYVLAVERAFKRAGGSFVSTVCELDAHIATAAERLKDPNPPSAAALWRWWCRFSPTRCPTKLTDRRERSGRRRDENVFCVFEESIGEVLLTPQKFPELAVYEDVTKKLGRMNEKLPEDQKIRIPSKSTIHRWIKELYYALVKKAREGKKITEREMRMAQDGVKVRHILERVEIDHTVLDLQVIDKTTGLVLGRPWITLAIDRRSRCVLGFYISFNAPSAYSVMACLRRAILPKGDLLARFRDIRSEWRCCGIPDLIAVDNGMDLHSDDVEAACLEMAIEVLFCGVAHPEMKGAVERVFRTIAEDLIHQLPGTTFSNPKERGDYPSEQLAAIDMETLVHLLVKWIVDIYHNRPHRGLRGRKPAAVWLEGESERLIELPANPAELDVIASHTGRATLFHYGIQVDYLFYNSPLLREIRLRDGGTPILEVRYREEDVGSVWVREPKTEEFFEVPCTDQAYAAGLNRAVHRLVKAEMRERFGDSWGQAQLLEVKEEIQGLVAKAVKAKKIVDRKRAAAALMQDSEEVFGDTSTDSDSAPEAAEPAERDTSVPPELAELLDDIAGYPSVRISREGVAA